MRHDKKKMWKLALDGVVYGTASVMMIGSLLACVTSSYRRPDNRNGANTNGSTTTPTDKNKTTASVDEKRCENKNPQACVDFARTAVKKGAQNPEMSSRAVQAFFQACELGRGDACYSYALMVWLAEGTEFNLDEVRYGLDRAGQLGYPKSKVDITQLVDMDAAQASPSPATLYHYKEACDLGIQRSCAIFTAETKGRRITLPTPPTGVQPQPKIAAKKPNNTTPPPVTAKTPKTNTNPLIPNPANTAAKTPPTRKPDSPVIIHNPFRSDPAATKKQPSKPAPSPATKTAAPVTDPLLLIRDRGLQVEGALDFSAAMKTIQPRRSQLAFCYEKEWRANPKLAGTVAAKIQVAPQGHVKDVSFNLESLTHYGVIDCIKKNIKLWHFAATSNQSTIVYRMEFGSK